MRNRIAEFAAEMTPALASVAGEMIKTLARVPPDRRQSACEGMFKVFKEQERETASRLIKKLFSPLNPWSEEAAVAAAKLLQAAFFLALESDSIWDHRLSSKSIAEVIGCNMGLYIRAYQKDLLAHGFNDPIEIGDITMEEGLYQ